MNSDQINKIFRLKTNISSTDYLVSVLNKDELVLRFEDYLKFSKLNTNHNSLRSWNRFLMNLDYYLGFSIIPEEVTECESKFIVRFDPRILYLKDLLDGTNKISVYDRKLFNTKSALPILEVLFNLSELDSVSLWNQIKYNKVINKSFVQGFNKRFGTKHTSTTLKNCIIGLLSY